MNKQALDIDHLAKLVRLRLSDEEKQSLSQQLHSIVDYCSKIAAADVDNLEPMVHSFEHASNVWAEDVPNDEMSRDYLSKNAPEMKENQIVIPKVL